MKSTYSHVSGFEETLKNFLTKYEKLFNPKKIEYVLYGDGDWGVFIKINAAEDYSTTFINQLSKELIKKCGYYIFYYNGDQMELELFKPRNKLED